MMRVFWCALTLQLWIGTTVASAQVLRTTPPEKIRTREGFQVERVYSVPDEQGSWVSLTVDEQGRLIASDQYGSLYRITPPALDSGDAAPQVEQLQTPGGYAHGLLYAYNSLYVVQSERDRGVYRLRDTTGDGQFDQRELIRPLDGGGEHGPHSLALGPDGKIYLTAGNHTDLPPIDSSVVPRNWQEDLLLPRMWDANGHARGRMAPGGWIVRMDPDGSNWELVSIGYRNEYDLAFNQVGELFTFDADMEWDIGAPWYRPTRILHVTSGSEFGWRSGTGKWPEYYIDSLPSVIDIGPGSPTGTVFGTGARFPARYQQALYACDWSYGVIYAVHLEGEGASYRAEAEQFVSGAPLPVTDLIVNPHDGSLYFAIGGRRAPSGLYRVRYTGDASTAPAGVPEYPQEELRKQRLSLEALHRAGAENAVEIAWPQLAHPDRHIRYAARIAIEHQPVAQWQTRTLQETNPRILIAAAVALARNGDASVKDPLLDRLAEIDTSAFSVQEKLDLLRAVSLIFIRLGEPTEQQAEHIGERLSSVFPTDDESVNREIANLLVYVQAPQAAEQIMARLRVAPTQEQQVHYALILRNLKTGWTNELRRDYFSWFPKSKEFRGGHSFAKFLENIRQEAFENVPPSERKPLEALLQQPIVEEPNFVFQERELVRQWTVKDLAADAEQETGGRDFNRGREMFAVANCFKCHRVQGEGGSVGPDLTGVGRRFDARYILESLIEPDKVVSDQYRATTFVLNNGQVVTGRVGNIAGNNIMVMTDMLDPGNFTNVDRFRVEETHESLTSMMPAGLLNTLEKEEILDLLAYLRSGGDPTSEFFQ